MGFSLISLLAGVLCFRFANDNHEAQRTMMELVGVRQMWSRFMKWLSPSGRVGETEVAGEFPVSPWVTGGTPRGVGSAESYQLGPKHYVRVSLVPVKTSSFVDISYSGMLAQNGADAIYVRCGDGPGLWENVRDVPMEYNPDTSEWTASVRASERPGKMEFCFHDGADSWDNNNGRNWSVTVLKND